ncbi:DUF397 domain-containing protein [Actinomadura chokoriensis]|uniref:DUF397 domain-containing protein n=1 Tax=Actinomadura chokoriensis TaxID=454156 RepID=UPI0031F72306
METSRAKWRKSTRSNGAGGDCPVNQAVSTPTTPLTTGDATLTPANPRERDGGSSQSGQNGACVEVARIAQSVAIRDSRAPARAALRSATGSGPLSPTMHAPVATTPSETTGGLPATTGTPRTPHGAKHPQRGRWKLCYRSNTERSR